MLNILHSKQLKGIAIILVIIGHLHSKYHLELPNIFYYAGAWGVSIFLLVSGYGLSSSYLKHGIDKTFLVRRFNKVLLPYSLITLLWIIIDTIILNKTYSIKTIIFSLLGIYNAIDSSMWYISFIFLWYIFFYLIFSIKFPNSVKAILITFSSIIFIKTNGAIYFFVFPLGVIMGIYYKNIKLKYLVLICLMSFLVFMVFVDKSNLFPYFYYMIANLMITIFFVSLILIMNAKNKLLENIGTISFELYLLEFVFITKYPIKFIYIYLVAIIAMSYLLHKVITSKPLKLKMIKVTPPTMNGQ